MAILLPAIFAVGAVPGAIAGILAIRNNQPIGGAKKGWHVLGYEPDNLSAQGSIVPLLIGRRRIGCVVAGSWGRYVQNVTTTVNGKGRKKRKSTGQQVFFEKAWHLICVGPAFRLHGIYQGGRPLFVPETPIDSTTTPSGSTITATDGSGDFGRIYWGEEYQPIDDELRVHIKDQNGTPIQSRWPYICHFVWGSKRLGPTPRWDRIEYDIEVLPQGQLLYASWFDIIGEGGYKPTNGYNHVEILAQLLFCKFPHGLALPEGGSFAGAFDISSFHVAANVLKNEDVGASVLIKDGQDAADAIETILLEAGLFLSRDPETGLLRVDAVRKGSAMVVPHDVLLHPIETTVEHENRPGTRLVYEFQDSGRNFQSSTITLDEDGIADRYAHPKARKIQLGTVIDQDSANKVAERRSQEEFGGASAIKMRMNRNAFLLKPNDLLTLPGIDEVYRVAEVTIQQDTTEVEISLVPDYYGSEPSTNTKPATPNPSIVVAVEADVQATVVEVPAALLDPGEPTQIIVPRVRAHDQVAYADIHLSTDDTTYERVDAEFGVVTGGKLLEALPADAPYVIDEGPTIELLGPPDDDVLDDLSADLANWRLGRQVAVIGGEFFFIQKLTPISGSTYRLDGLMRARYGTVREAHAIGAEVYMFRLDDITPISDPTLMPGASIYVKAQPFAQTGLSLAEVTAINKTIYGHGLRPPAPCGLRVSAPAPGVRAYSTGQDVSLKWASALAYPPSLGFGMASINTPVGAGALHPNTTYVVKVYDAADNLVAIYDESDGVGEDGWTYANADLQADLGGETNFRIEVYEVRAGLYSDPAEINVEAL